MVKLLNYCLSALAAAALVSCQEPAPLFKKQFSKAQQKELAKTLTDGIHAYYQGTVAQQFLLEEALRYDSANGDTWREKGVPFLKRGLAVEFEEHYQNAVQYNPAVWAGWRGYIYLFFYRDYKRAIADFDYTDELTPNLVDYPQALSVDYLRALCYLKLNQLDTSVALFKKHIAYEAKISGEKYVLPQAYLYQGIALFKQKEYASALASINSGLKNDSKNGDLLFWKAKTLHALGKQKEAQETIRATEDEIRRNNRNIRPYVEEFFPTYLSDVLELKQLISG